MLETTRVTSQRGSPGDSLLALATATAGVLDVRRLILVAVRHLVPALAPAAAVVVVDDGTLQVAAADADGPRECQQAVRCLKADARAALAGLSGASRVLAEADRRAVQELVPLSVGEHVHLVPLPLTADGATAGLLLDAGAGPPGSHLAPLLSGHLDAAVRYGRRTRLAALLAEAYRPRLGDVPGLDVASRYRPSREEDGIGGDFVDLVDGDDDLTVVVGDVDGHGADAAVVTGQVRQALRAAGRLTRRPERQMALADAVMRAERTPRYATAVAARLTSSPSGVRLSLARAGHPPALLMRADGEVDVLHPHGAVLGALPSPTWARVSRSMCPGDTLLLYTDGVTDARGPRGLFGLARLVDSLRSFAGASADGIVGRVEEKVVEHLAGGPHDDIAVVAVRVPEPSTGEPS